MAATRSILRADTYTIGSPDTAERMYLVDIETGDDPYVAASAGSGVGDPVPAVGAPYSAARSTTTAATIACELLDPTTVRVRVSYTGPEASGGSGPANVNPTTLPSRIQQRSFAGRQRYFIDVDDEPVANSAGDPFAELPERDVVEGWTFVITKEILNSQIGSWETYIKSINSNTLSIRGRSFPADTCRIDDIEIGPDTVTQISSGTVTHATLTVTITARPSWDDEFEDRGFVDGERKDILDLHGRRVRDPWPLDGAGAALANAGDPPAIIVRKPYMRRNIPAILYS